MTTEQNATDEHPSWCSPTDCQTAPNGRVHLSGPVRTQSPWTDLAVTVQLVQRSFDGRPDLGQPFIDFLIAFPDYGPDHPGEEYSFCFDSNLAQAAGQMLLDAGREASSPTRPQTEHARNGIAGS